MKKQKKQTFADLRVGIVKTAIAFLPTTVFATKTTREKITNVNRNVIKTVQTGFAPNQINARAI